MMPLMPWSVKLTLLARQFLRSGGEGRPWTDARRATASTAAAGVGAAGVDADGNTIDVTTDTSGRGAPARRLTLTWLLLLNLLD